MRISNFLLPTLREAPSDTEIISHQLMVRAGMVRQVASGIYTWLPLGLRVLRKVEKIVREEMDKTGAQEIFMPSVQPAELWQESKRWEEYGPELLRFNDRHQRAFCLGPTHEEVVTDLIRKEIRSYKQLPANFYQIQNKFRDEIRPRFGIMRAREFLMKDAYSFHLDQDSLEATYKQMYKAYCAILERVGLDYRPVIADTGNIGGSKSHEFHVLADAGEDQIAFNESGTYAANVEMVPIASKDDKRPLPTREIEKIQTAGKHSIEEVCSFLNAEPSSCIKTIIVEGIDESLVGLILRGDHELNVIKAEKLEAVAKPLRFASSEKIKSVTGVTPGSLGPQNLPFPVYADQEAYVMANFICGANEDGWHLQNACWDRDIPEPLVADLRNVEVGDPAPNGDGRLAIKRGIEVGHIFQLGTKYSESMKAKVLNEKGTATIMRMGCYGIGVSRIVAAAIEQRHDQSGILWPESIAPFACTIAPINMHKSKELMLYAEGLYRDLQDAGYEVLFYDTKNRPGVMFADLDLIGIPHRFILSDRGMSSATVEYKNRADSGSQELNRAEVLNFFQRLVARTTDNY